jgi:hypothetical protein
MRTSIRAPGLIRPNKAWRSFTALRKAHEVRMAVMPPARKTRHIHNGKTHWSRQARRVFDAVLKRPVRPIQDAWNDDSLALYGHRGVYALSKRQLSRREIESHGLPK